MLRLVVCSRGLSVVVVVFFFFLVIFFVSGIVWIENVGGWGREEGGYGVLVPGLIKVFHNLNVTTDSKNNCPVN